MTTLKIRKPYDASSRSRLSFSGESMTKQSFKAECDINTIMSKYQKTGILEHARNVAGAYGDFSDVPDFQEARNRLIAAEQAFMALPATVRKRFDNDPAEFVAFFDDPDNLEEAVQLGLIPQNRERSDPIEAKPKSPAEPVEPKGSEATQGKKSGKPDNTSD